MRVLSEYNAIYKATNTTLTSEYGPRDFDGFHYGVDFDFGDGSLLYAVCDGEVTQNYFDVNGGYTIHITNNGKKFIYYHMKEPSHLTVGQRVIKGTYVGKQGGTGEWSQGSHCHFEVQNTNGVAEDPMSYCIFPSTAVTETNADAIVSFLHSNGNRYYMYANTSQDDLKQKTDVDVRYEHILTVTSDRTFYRYRTDNQLSSPSGTIYRGSTLSSWVVWRKS